MFTNLCVSVQSSRSRRARPNVCYTDSPARKAAKTEASERNKNAAELVVRGVYCSSYDASKALGLPESNIRYYVNTLRASGVAKALHAEEQELNKGKERVNSTVANAPAAVWVC